ncbi:hypothetical protein RclHR1_02930021 [Rhizophagus clarus]|uniref:Arrestin C-terminal-like domain-containing protein n=1 Tax=Rhizophagus clarus TaxID=94130 RepID=A0A2Z6R8A7_9GLOM|nr:hypothetical protein RclHR1_02930021 [Rhizophagus clarus]
MQALSTYFSDFFIQLNDSARNYFPGEEVRGAIIVQSSKTIKSSAVRLKLRGKVTSRDRDFFLFEKEVLIGEQLLVEKCLHFPFSFNLPTDIPSSCLFSGYAITYTLKAALQTVSWFSETFLRKCSTEIKILDDINIKNYPPPVIRPFQIEVKGKKKFRGFAHINIEISKGAIMRGQSVPIAIHIKHIAPIKNLEGVLIALYKRTKTISKNGKEETTRKVISSTILPILINPDTLETVINTKVTVPDKVPPTVNNARYFFISYSIEINVDLAIKKTIFETSSNSKVGKHSYAYLRKKMGKYNGYFNIPLVIGTTDNNSYDNDNYVNIHHHMRRPSEWTIGTIGSTINHPFDPSLLSALSLPNSYSNCHHYHNEDGDNYALSWDGTGTISPVPSAPSVDDFEVHDDFNIRYSS